MHASSRGIYCFCKLVRPYSCVCLSPQHQAVQGRSLATHHHATNVFQKLSRCAHECTLTRHDLVTELCSYGLVASPAKQSSLNFNRLWAHTLSMCIWVQRSDYPNHFKPFYQNGSEYTPVIKVHEACPACAIGHQVWLCYRIYTPATGANRSVKALQLNGSFVPNWGADVTFDDD